MNFKSILNSAYIIWARIPTHELCRYCDSKCQRRYKTSLKIKQFHQKIQIQFEIYFFAARKFCFGAVWTFPFNFFCISETLIENANFKKGNKTKFSSSKKKNLLNIALFWWFFCSNKYLNYMVLTFFLDESWLRSLWSDATVANESIAKTKKVFKTQFCKKTYFKIMFYLTFWKF